MTVGITSPIVAQFLTPEVQKDFLKSTRSLMRYRQFSSWDWNHGYKNGMTATWSVANKLTPEAPIVPGAQTPVEDQTDQVGECTIREYKKGSMFDKTATDVSRTDVKAMIEDNLAIAFAESVEIYGARPAFAQTNIKVCPKGGNSNSEIDVHNTDPVNQGGDGAFTGVNNAAFTIDHLLEMNLAMDELDIPDRDGKRIFIGSPYAFRNIKKEIFNLSQHSSEGFANIINGKLGEVDNSILVKQTAVKRQAWASGVSDEIFAFGADSIVELMIEAENIIPNVPANFNSEQGLAYRALLGHAIVRKNRVLHWTSAS